MEQNYSKALKWFSEAAKENNPDAQYYMGLAYFYGYGVNEDEERAIECFKIASDNNCLEAIMLLSKIYEEKDIEETNVLLEKAVNLNCSEAMYKLGYNYAHGKFVEKDLSKAVLLYQKAADKDNAQAQCNLALCYLNGKGLEKNLSFGVYWLERAVNNGSAVAAFNLGRCYENGMGVEVSSYVALKHYLIAANKENYDAQLAVARLYKDSDKNQAIYWYNKASVKYPDEAYLGLVNIYIKEPVLDEDKVRMLLENIKNKNLEAYVKAEENFKKILNERAEI